MRWRRARSYDRRREDRNDGISQSRATDISSRRSPTLRTGEGAVDWPIHSASRLVLRGCPNQTTGSTQWARRKGAAGSFGLTRRPTDGT